MYIYIYIHIYTSMYRYVDNIMGLNERIRPRHLLPTSQIHKFPAGGWD